LVAEWWRTNPTEAIQGDTVPWKEYAFFAKRSQGRVLLRLAQQP
jgi:hypothetical protein